MAPLLAQNQPATRQTPAAEDQGPPDSVLRQIWPNLPPNQDPTAVARGKRLFEANCSFCHGPEATGGNGGPDLIRSVLVNHDDKGNLIGPVVHNGRPDKGMPTFSSLSDQQISDLVAFLHQRNRDARLRFTYKVENVAIGDASAGKSYFAAHCSNCHSATGDLAGLASKYPADVLQQLWLSPQPRSGTGDTQLSDVTITLPSGQTFSGKLAHLDEFDVSLYDARGYHSFPRTSGTKVEVQNPLAAHEELLSHLTDSDMHNVTTYLETLK
ncbi:MAG: c-type cytochrome [Acidobacteriaceae bacterium]|nr:c-type cytochrome [Acidobacteriaceae bacterium]